MGNILRKKWKDCRVQVYGIIMATKLIIVGIKYRENCRGNKKKIDYQTNTMDKCFLVAKKKQLKKKTKDAIYRGKPFWTNFFRSFLWVKFGTCCVQSLVYYSTFPSLLLLCRFSIFRGKLRSYIEFELFF